jgi:hypothetical protein
MPHRAFLCRMLFCAVFSVSMVNIFTKATSPSLQQQTANNHAHHRTGDVFCPRSELADDVLVVLRTGATESLEKVPVHLRTTLQCVPHFVIHSDLDEEIEQHAVHDVLKGVSEERRRDDDDFKLYRQLQEHGRGGVKQQQVITSLSGSSQGDYLRTSGSSSP